MSIDGRSGNITALTPNPDGCSRAAGDRWRDFAPVASGGAVFVGAELSHRGSDLLQAGGCAGGICFPHARKAGALAVSMESHNLRGEGAGGEEKSGSWGGKWGEDDALTAGGS